MIYILVGPPCSGKTTCSKSMMKDNPNLKRVSFDDERRWFHGKFAIGDHSSETVVKEITYSKAHVLLDNGYDVIIDNNNLHNNILDGIIKRFIATSDITIRKMPYVDIDVLLKRNIERSKVTGKLVPIDFIKKAHRQSRNLNIDKEFYSQVVN